jgi:hypothetical protein
MSLSQQNIQNNEIDHRYLDLTIRGTESVLQTASFSATRTIPYLKTCNEFELGIVRFSVPSTLIPIFFFGEKVYRVSLGYSNVNVDVNVIYSPDTLVVSPYSVDKPVYSVSNFIRWINTALSTANTTLQTLQPLYTATAPQIEYEPSTRLFKLYAPTIYNSTLATPAFVGFNSTLYDFLRSFGASYVSLTDTFVLDVYPTLTNTQTINTINYIVITTDTPIVDNWETLQQVVISTSSIPVNPEMRAFGNTSLPVQRSILTDFNFSGLLEDNALLQYYTSGYVRWYDLLSNNELNKVDLEMLWVDREGKTYPIYLLANETANLKICFRKKSRFSNGYIDMN